MAILVWIVDDNVCHHQTAALTLARLPLFELEGYASGGSAIAEFASRSELDPSLLPRIVLMDYFLGDSHGDTVTSELRRLHDGAFRPVIVGYSSMRSGSEAIVAAGGDVIVRKRIAHDGSNPDLRVYLDSYARIATRT
jgi:CheY-like chemotaxis protein